MEIMSGQVLEEILLQKKKAERWVVAGGEYGVKEEFSLLFIFAMMKLC